MRTFFPTFVGFIAVSLLWLVTACGGSNSQSASKDQPESADRPRATSHDISIELPAIPAGFVLLANHLGSQQYIVDTLYAQDNRVRIKGDTALPRGIYLVAIPPRNNYFEMILGDDQEFSMVVGDTADLVGSMTIEGSEENRVFYDNLREINVVGMKITEARQKLDALPADDPQRETLQETIQQYNEQINAFRTAVAEKHPDLLYAKVITTMRDPKVPENPDPSDSLFAYRYFRAHFWDGMDWNEPGLVRTPVLEGKLNQYLDQYTYQYPDSLKKTALWVIDQARQGDSLVFQYVSTTLLNKYAKSKIMGQDAVYVAIVEDVYGSGDATWSDAEQTQKIIERAQALSPTLIGGVAPDFTMANTQNQAVSLSQVPGKYTILYFWDYDCSHCKKVTPKLAKLYPKYRDRDVSLVTVSINGDFEVWNDKLETYGLADNGGIHVQDHARQTGFDDKYDILTTPRIFLLDEEKKIIAKQISVDQLEDMLDRMLKES